MTAPLIPLGGTLEDILEGPQPLGRTDRLRIAEAIADTIRARFGERVIAIALYGSTARSTDGPFSDIELWAALDDEPRKKRWRANAEWVWGAGKAEANLWSATAIRERAAEIDGDWALTHGAVVHAVAIYEREAGFVEDLHRRALALPEAKVAAVVAQVIVGDLYELLGKVRNIVALGRAGEAPRQMLQLAETAAKLTALATGYCFGSGATLMEEAQGLRGPPGYKGLISFARGGDFTDMARVQAAAERYWSGLAEWIKAPGMKLDDQLTMVFR